MIIRRKVLTNDAIKYCKENGFMGFIETSAKSGKNIIEVNLSSVILQAQR